MWDIEHIFIFIDTGDRNPNIFSYTHMYRSPDSLCSQSYLSLYTAMATVDGCVLKPSTTCPTLSSEGFQTLCPQSFWSQTNTVAFDSDHAPTQSSILISSPLLFGCFLLAETVSLYSVFTAYFGLSSRVKILLQK